MKTLILILILFLPIILSAQTEWEESPDNPVLEVGPSGSWDDKSVVGPCVILVGDIYKMWYQGYDGSTMRIGHATSPDGINWTKSEMNPVLDVGASGTWDDDNLGYPCVLYDGSLYKMWYHAYDGSNERIGYAISTDGISWTKREEPVLYFGSAGSWDDKYVMMPQVLFIDNEYIMWYGGSDSGFNIRIGCAKSTDGVTWTKEDSLNPVMNISQNWEENEIRPGSVLYVDSLFRIWYYGGTGLEKLRTGYATSVNGLNWNKHDTYVLDYGASGEWDYKFAMANTVYFDGKKYHMWYDSANWFTSGAIGYATSDVDIVSPVPDTAQVERVAGPFNFLEGPLWHPDGFLLCSEMDENRVLKIDPQTGSMEVYLNPSEESNGLAFDIQQKIIMCCRDKPQLAYLDSNGNVIPLASHYNGKRLNSPNDLTIRSDGTIIFTDPYFNNDSPAPQELDFEGIFALKPDGELVLLESTVPHPNGICLSPDEERLYVDDTFNKRIYVFDIDNDLRLTNKSVFATIYSALGLDGMKVDENGLLFCSAGDKGIQIFSPDGEYVDKIDVDGLVLNINWGDDDYQTLYITEKNYVYKIRLNTKGFIPEFATEVENIKVRIPSNYDLKQNYPNPFNPSTTLKYEIPKESYVTLKVYDILGREVVTLVNQQQKAGFYETTWNAANLPSGIYLISIRAMGLDSKQNFTQVKKALLLK